MGHAVDVYQRVDLRAFVERRALNGFQVVAKGFATRGGALDGAA
jgi:hypothetical protein